MGSWRPPAPTLEAQDSGWALWGRDLPSSGQCTPSPVAQTPGKLSCGPHLRTEHGLRAGSPCAAPRPGPALSGSLHFCVPGLHPWAHTACQPCGPWNRVPALPLGPAVTLGCLQEASGGESEGPAQHQGVDTQLSRRQCCPDAHGLDGAGETTRVRCGNCSPVSMGTPRTRGPSHPTPAWPRPPSDPACA